MPTQKAMETSYIFWIDFAVACDVKKTRWSKTVGTADVWKCLTMSPMMLRNIWRFRGVLHLSKAKGNDAYSKMVLYGTKLLFIFPNNIYQQVKLVFVCCHFQLPLKQILLWRNYNLHSEMLSTVTLIKIQFFYFLFYSCRVQNVVLWGFNYAPYRMDHTTWPIWSRAIGLKH